MPCLSMGQVFLPWKHSIQNYLNISSLVQLLIYGLVNQTIHDWNSILQHQISIFLTWQLQELSLTLLKLRFYSFTLVTLLWRAESVSILCWIYGTHEYLNTPIHCPDSYFNSCPPWAALGMPLLVCIREKVWIICFLLDAIVLNYHRHVFIF